MHRIVTGDEEWIHSDNLKVKKAYIKRGLPQAKQDIHVAKVMLRICWEPLYYEFLKSKKQIDSFEACHHRKTPAIRTQTRDHNFPS